MDRDRMLAISLIKDKLDGKTTLNYKEIAVLSGFHPKYILRLKKEIMDNTLSMVHGNKNRKPINAISEQEQKTIEMCADYIIYSLFFNRDDFNEFVKNRWKD